MPINTKYELSNNTMWLLLLWPSFVCFNGVITHERSHCQQHQRNHEAMIISLFHKKAVRMLGKFPSFSDVDDVRSATEIQQSKSGTGTCKRNVEIRLSIECAAYHNSLLFVLCLGGTSKETQHNFICQCHNSTASWTSNPTVKLRQQHSRSL